MIRLDSCKFLTDFEVIEDIKLQHFDSEIRMNGTSQILKQKRVLSSDYKVIGLKNIEVTTNNLLIELSAKILKENYYEGINKNTVSQMVDNINGCKSIKLNTNKFLDSAKVLRCDVTDNLKVKNNVNDYLSLLNTYKVNSDYLVSFYNRKAGSSIVFDRNVKSYKERLTLYDKEKEIYRDKELIKLFDQEALNRFNNVLRCEQNIVSFSKIREKLHINSIDLKDVLNSKELVNYNTFTNITKENKALTLFNSYKDKDLHYIIRLYGMRFIIELYEYDFSLIKQLIREHYNGNACSYWYKNFAILMREMKQEKKNYNSAMEAINEISDLLKVA